MKRLMEEKLQAGRQKRIDHLHGSAIRRMLYADVAAGGALGLTSGRRLIVPHVAHCRQSFDQTKDECCVRTVAS